jgi:hypothetical protein
MIRSIGAPSPQNGSTFLSWSDGGAATHEITVPATNTTFTANYSGGTTCGTGETPFNGRCYFRIATLQTFNQASSACTSRGTGWRLVVIGDDAENTFVDNLIGNVESWLGATDRTTEGTFVWVTGAAVAGGFTRFDSGEPNNTGGTGAADCLRMVTTGFWRDEGCDTPRGAVCERP